MIRIFIFLTLLSCSKKKSDFILLEQFVNNQKISNEEVSLKVTKTILLNDLKNFEYQENSLYINFGSNLAYTFNSTSNYSESIQFQVIKFILNFNYFTKKRNFNELRISYSKPFFSSQDGKETVSEFEIFRIKIDLKELNKIPEIDKLRYLDNEKKMNSNLREIFNQVRLIWKVEMDETKRVELK